MRSIDVIEVLVCELVHTATDIGALETGDVNLDQRKIVFMDNLPCDGLVLPCSEVEEHDP